MRIKTVDISDEAAEVLRRGVWSGKVFMLPAGHLEKPLYAQVDKALRALGGKWHKGLRGHLFAQDAADAMRAALESGNVVDTKRTLEQFFTPAALAEHIVVQLAGVTRGTLVLEPSAGGGALVGPALDQGASVIAVEIDQGLAGALKILGQMRGGDLNVINTDFLNVPVLSITPTVVVMNPPFSRGQDMAHVRHAFAMLAPGGTLVAIMSPHWVQSTDRASNDFRVFLSQLGDDAYDWESLPEGSFKQAGTGVNTGVLLLRKAA